MFLLKNAVFMKIESHFPNEENENGKQIYLPHTTLFVGVSAKCLIIVVMVIGTRYGGQ
jgi:hypothetical protein